MSTQHKFRVPRIPDDQVVARMTKAFEDASWKDVTLAMRPVAGPEMGGPLAKLPQEAASVLAAQSQLVLEFTFSAPPSTTIRIHRPEEQPFDEVHMTFPGTARPGADAERCLALARAAKSHLKELRAEDALGLLGPQLQHHYEVREAELSRLESALARVVTQLAEDSSKVRQHLEDEFSTRRAELEAVAREQRERDKQVAEERSKALDSRDEELKKRLASVDDRDSRHARRQIRSDIKQALAKRAEKFELTANTRQLRRPLQLFSLVLLALFGTGFLFYSIEGAVGIFQAAEQGTVKSVDSWLVALRLALFGVAFGSTAIFYIRWNNRWFEQHASEEFQLKRLELDLDRASWVVEMAMEWKDEKDSEIPPHLLDRLTANLFAATKTEHEPLHPADQLASVLLGSASGATLKGPGGSEVRFDGKALRNLDKKDGQAE